MLAIIFAGGIGFLLGIVAMAILQISREADNEGIQRQDYRCNCNHNVDVCRAGGVSGRGDEGKEHDPTVVEYWG